MLKHESKYEAVLLVCIVRAQARVCAVMVLLRWGRREEGNPAKETKKRRKGIEGTGLCES